MSGFPSDVTAAEAKQVYENSLRRHGRPPKMRDVAAAFASVGRHVNERTLRLWLRNGWSDHQTSPFDSAVRTFGKITSYAGAELMALMPELEDVKPVGSARVLDAYEGTMKRLDAMTMAQLIEDNARAMLKTSLFLQELIAQKGEHMLLEKPTGLSQVLRGLKDWNEIAHTAVDGVIMLRERSMKLETKTVEATALPAPTNVLQFVAAKPGDKTVWSADDALADVR